MSNAVTERTELAYKLMLGELLPSFLHEINNPLTIINNLFALGTFSAPAEDAEIVESLQKAVNAATEMTNIMVRVCHRSADDYGADLLMITRELKQIMGARLRHANIQMSMQAPETSSTIALPVLTATIIVYVLIEWMISGVNTSGRGDTTPYILHAGVEAMPEDTLRYALQLSGGEAGAVDAIVESWRGKKEEALLPESVRHAFSLAKNYIAKILLDEQIRRICKIDWRSAPGSLTLSADFTPR